MNKAAAVITARNFPSTRLEEIFSKEITKIKKYLMTLNMPRKLSEKYPLLKHESPFHRIKRRNIITGPFLSQPNCLSIDFLTIQTAIISVAAISTSDVENATANRSV
ncbi:MAG: hypothetical protein HQL30_01955 [Candidatus Omnitrophica bacterium]|nr:hypothetical protein [Candidatus Omnitrophota bacterium]